MINGFTNILSQSMESIKESTGVLLKRLNTTVFIGLNLVKIRNNLSEIGEELMTLFHKVKNATSDKYKFRAAATFAKKGILDFISDNKLQYEISSKSVVAAYQLTKKVLQPSFLVCPTIYEIIPRKELPYFSKANMILPNIGIEAVYEYTNW